MCKSSSIFWYESSVNVVIFTPAVGYTSSVLGTSTHTNWFPELSSITNPVLKYVPSTLVYPSGIYNSPLDWYNSIVSVSAIFAFPNWSVAIFAGNANVNISLLCSIFVIDSS